MTDNVPIRNGQILQDSLFNELMRVETVQPLADHVWTLGLVDTQSERFRRVMLTPNECRVAEDRRDCHLVVCRDPLQDNPNAPGTCQRPGSFPLA